VIGAIHHEDCRETAKRMTEAGILADCIITSPPYPQGKKNVEDMGRYRRSGTAEEQREQIGVGRKGDEEWERAWHEWGKTHSPGGGPKSGHIHGKPNAKGETGLEVRIAAPDWLDWFVGIARDLKPRLKQNGNFIVNVDSCCYPTRHRHWGVFSLPERMEQIGYCFAEAMVWTKPNGPPVSARTHFNHSWEFVYHFSNGDQWETDLSGIRTEHVTDWTGAKTNRFSTERLGYHRGKTTSPPNPKGARPKDVFDCAVGGMRWDVVGGAHFAAMPLELAEWMVKWASKPGDLIFDPFLGAATTAVAAIRLGRRWIGSEITEAAALVAERRVALARDGFFGEELAEGMANPPLPLEATQ